MPYTPLTEEQQLEFAKRLIGRGPGDSHTGKKLMVLSGLRKNTKTKVTSNFFQQCLEPLRQSQKFSDEILFAILTQVNSKETEICNELAQFPKKFADQMTTKFINFMFRTVEPEETGERSTSPQKTLCNAGQKLERLKVMREFASKGLDVADFPSDKVELSIIKSRLRISLMGTEDPPVYPSLSDEQFNMLEDAEKNTLLTQCLKDFLEKSLARKQQDGSLPPSPVPLDFPVDEEEGPPPKRVCVTLPPQTQPGLPSAFKAFAGRGDQGKSQSS